MSGRGTGRWAAGGRASSGGVATKSLREERIIEQRDADHHCQDVEEAVIAGESDSELKDHDSPKCDSAWNARREDEKRHDQFCEEHRPATESREPVRRAAHV